MIAPCACTDSDTFHFYYYSVIQEVLAEYTDTCSCVCCVHQTPLCPVLRLHWSGGLFENLQCHQLAEAQRSSGTLRLPLTGKACSATEEQASSRHCCRCDLDSEPQRQRGARSQRQSSASSAPPVRDPQRQGSVPSAPPVRVPPPPPPPPPPVQVGHTHLVSHSLQRLSHLHHKQGDHAKSGMNLIISPSRLGFEACNLQVSTSPLLHCKLHNFALL